MCAVVAVLVNRTKGVLVDPPPASIVGAHVVRTSSKTAFHRETALCFSSRFQRRYALLLGPRIDERKQISKEHNAVVFVTTTRTCVAQPTAVVVIFKPFL